MCESNPRIAIGNFEAAIRRAMAAGLTKPQAIRDVVAKRPELHRAYVLAVNASRPAAQEMFVAKFGRDLELARRKAAAGRT